MALSYLIYRGPREPTYYSNSSADHLTYSGSRRPINRRRARDSDAQRAVEPFITLHQKPLNASSCKPSRGISTQSCQSSPSPTHAGSHGLSSDEGY
ncbi:unnamed protein product [Spirodela intermedia]|uniref:Uncharacterized protein n=1 Tax=Spirodela intermedia TaxID=51605 RepID=A0A7I8J647_SPIIN|nr:unnamed protein product [Spirodela intermedia]CAA6665514.1 unnamed protein product [Spirodela intermedia]